MNQSDVMRVWLLLILLVCPSLQFSIRRRGVSHRNESPYDLKQALSALDRQRRRIEEAEYFQQGQQKDDDFLSSKKRVPTMQHDNYYDFGDDSDVYIPVRQSELSQLLASYENQYGTENVDSHRTIPSLTELQNIFANNEDSSENESNPEDQNQDENNEDVVDDITESELLDDQKDETEKEEDEEIDTILEANDAMEPDNPSEEMEPSTEEVSKEELEDVFSNQEEDEDIIPEQNVGDPSLDNVEDDGDDDQQYGVLKNFLATMDENKRRMIKRDDKSGKSQSEKDLRGKIKKLRKQLEKLKLMQMMEDKENDYLASALKGATLSQIEGSRSFLKGEFDDIQNAIKLEELLQNVKVDEDEDDQEDSNAYLKRSDLSEEMNKMESLEPPVDDSLGRWYDEPVKNDVDGGAFLKPSEYDDEMFLEEFAKENAPGLKRTLQVEVPLKEEIEFEEGLEKLNNILDTMTPEEREDLRYQIETIMSKEETPDQCTAATLLSSNCRFADALGLPIDDEARNLCNRHEICYICAATVGMTDAQCDAGYTGDALAICGQNENCDEDASLFLGLMQENHRYIPYGNEFCAAACVKDFIIGL